MPGSTEVGKREAVELLDYLGVLCTTRTVLDVGAGVGTWYDRLAPHLPGATFDAIEAWEPWVERCNLRARYDRVFVEDARTIDTRMLPRYDLVVYGDVIEHLTREDAMCTVHRLKGTVGLFSIPMAGGIHEHQSEKMHDYGTGEDFDCPFEKHLSSWTAQSVNATWNVAAQWTSQDIGVFVVDLSREA